MSGPPLCMPGLNAPTASVPGASVPGASVPIASAATGIPSATGTSTATATAAPSTHWVLWAMIAVVVLIAAVVVLVLARRLRRRRAGAGALAVILLAAAAGMVSPPPRAAASVTGDGSVAGAVAACVAGFNAAGGDPAGIMGTLDKPGVHVTVYLDNSGTNGENRLDPNNIFIYWNPTDTSPLSGGVPRVPCDELYHEMYHAFEDTTPQGVDIHECFDQAGKPTGIAIKEVHATEAENKLRASKGEPVRKQYGPNALPPGGCRPPKPDDPLCHPTRGCPVPPAKQGQTTADPHVTSFDGRRFDFQAAGEFVVSRDTAADPATAFQIQVREQPWPNSRLVAVNTAMAANVAGDRVEVTVQNGQMAVLVNGASHPLASGPLPKGGDLTYTPRTAGPFLTIDWPDRSYVLVTLYARHHHADRGAGRGPRRSPHRIAGQRRRELGQRRARGAGPDPRRPLPGVRRQSADQAGRLVVHLRPGTSTATYTDRTFPDRYSAPSPPDGVGAGLVRRQLDHRPGHAGQLHAGPGQQPAVPDCCGFTADPGHRDQLPPRRERHHPGCRPARPEGHGSLHRSRRAEAVRRGGGQHPAFGVRRPDAGGQSRQAARFGCIINGTGGIDVVTLPSDGTYQVVLSPPAGITGTATLRLVSATDQQGELAIDGPPVTVGVTTPGGTGRLTFNGTKGDVVYTDIPTSTLPSTCGSISLHDPKDDVLASGCVINGKGSIERTTLPVTGTYSFVLDPSDAVTGGVQVQLIRAIDQIGTIDVDGPSVSAAVARPGGRRPVQLRSPGRGKGVPGRQRGHHAERMW